MKRFALILILLGVSFASLVAFAKDDDYRLTAVMGINRGEYPGEYVTELRIGRTVFVSQDVCRKAEAKWNKAYPARRAKQDIWVLIGSVECRYHVTDEHPFLARGSRAQ